VAKSKVIECKNIVKTFHQGRNPIEILHGVDMEIYSGEYVILFGPSGCGKSTVLNIIAGLEPASSGQMKLRGSDITKFNEQQLAHHHRTKIGMVFQQFNLIKSLSILDNVALPQVFSGIRLGRRVKRAEHLLDMLGLLKFKDYSPGELSGGQQQRVAIARALVNNPWVLLIDEPTGNLDSKSASDVMELIRELNEKSKRTILLVTHNPEYVSYPNRVLYMKDGKIIRSVVNRAISEELDLPEENEEKLLKQAAVSAKQDDELKIKAS
jgi:ABC-type lipoprotein export system ATPase subunit